MSKLSQETIDKLKKEAIQADVKNINQSYQYRSGYRDGHLAGATEWAGRAQPVIDALEMAGTYISSLIEPALWNKEISDEQRQLIRMRNKIDDELAKYKEVENG